MDPTTLATAILTILAPYLAKAGESLAGEIGKKAPEQAGKLWEAVVQKFQGQPAAEAALQDLVRAPGAADNQAVFRKELRQTIEADSTWLAHLADLLEKAQAEAVMQSNKISGDGNITTLNISGSVRGNIVIGSNNTIGGE